MAAFPSLSPRLDKGYAHTDDRYNIFELDNASALEQQAAAVGAWMLAHQLEQTSSGYRLKSPLTTLSEEIDNPASNLAKSNGSHGPLGKDEKFGNEIIAADSTGFFVGRKLVLTAAHCLTIGQTNTLDPRRISQLRFVLGFRMSDAAACATTLTEVYEIEKVKCWHFRMEDGVIKADWALVVLKTDMASKRCLEIETDANNIHVGDEIYTLGYPSGLPLKCTKGGHVRDLKSHGQMIESQLGYDRCNSGGPVISQKTGRVIALHSHSYSSPDYIKEVSGDMVRRVVASGYERDQKISMLAGLIDAIEQEASQTEITKLWEQAKREKRDLSQISTEIVGHCRRLGELSSEASHRSPKACSGSLECNLL